MARAISGSVKWDEGKKRWKGRITVIGGRPWLDCPIEFPNNDRGEMRAREWILEKAILAKTEGMTVGDFEIAKRKAPAPVEAGKSADDYFDRLMTYAAEIGQTDVGVKRTRWHKWIAPTIGHKAMTEITRDDVEDIRDKLDAAIETWKREGATTSRAGEAISGKTAMNVWSALTSTMKAATNSKRRDLRVLEGKPNPCLGVEPPGDKDSRKVRRKTFLYPREGAQLLACELVPVAWRETYALALFLYARPGELRVLTWGDVDANAGHVSITKAWDYPAEKIKMPKTRNGVRRIPIEPALRPLLARMRKGKRACDAVVPTLADFGEDHLAEQFRKHLRIAKVDRAELHVTTATHVQANFRTCRDSGITWLAMSGLDVAKIVRRAGHDDVQTSMGYVKLAEDLTGELGDPFGPLPASLVEGDSSGESSGPSGTAVFPSENGAGEGIRTRSDDPRLPMNSDEFAIVGAPGYPLHTGPNPADSDRPDECETIEVCTMHESEIVDVSSLLGPPGLPAPLYDPIPKDEHGRPDWNRLHALVVAVEALVGAGMAAEARPLVGQLRGIVEAARGPVAPVIQLSPRRG